MSGRWTIEFDFGDGEILYAGKHKGAAGFAPTIAAAWIWDSQEAARRWLENGYGKATATLGKVIQVRA